MVKLGLSGWCLGALYLFCFLFSYCASSTADEAFINIGYQYHRLENLTGDLEFDSEQPSDNSYHVSLGRRHFIDLHKKHLFGFGLEVNEILGDTFWGLRATDYLYQLNQKWRLGAFFGAGTLASGRPQNGYYMGLSVHRLDFIPHADLGVELRYAWGLARDRLTTDPAGVKPDIFTDFISPSIFLAFRF